MHQAVAAKKYCTEKITLSTRQTSRTSSPIRLYNAACSQCSNQRLIAARVQCAHHAPRGREDKCKRMAQYTHDQTWISREFWICGKPYFCIGPEATISESLLEKVVATALARSCTSAILRIRRDEAPPESRTIPLGKNRCKK